MAWAPTSAAPRTKLSTKNTANRKRNRCMIFLLPQQRQFRPSGRPKGMKHFIASQACRSAVHLFGLVWLAIDGTRVRGVAREGRCAVQAGAGARPVPAAAPTIRWQPERRCLVLLLRGSDRPAAPVQEQSFFFDPGTEPPQGTLPRAPVDAEPDQPRRLRRTSTS